MPEILSRSKQETEEFKSKLEAGFGSDVQSDWFSDDAYADELERQSTAALEKTYAQPSYGERPADELLLPAGEPEPLLGSGDYARGLVDLENRNDYDDLNTVHPEIEDEQGIIDRAFPSAPEQPATRPNRTPRHALTYHEEEVSPTQHETVALPESKENLVDSRFNDLMSRAVDMMYARKAAIADGTATIESAVTDVEKFQKVFNAYSDEGLDQTSLDLVSKLFLGGYDVQVSAAPESRPYESTVPALTTESVPVTRSVEITSHGSVEDASSADKADRIALQDELEIDDEIENVVVTDETAPIAAPQAEVVAPIATRNSLKERIGSIKESAREIFRPQLGNESISAFKKGEFSGRKPVSVVIDGQREDGWSVANKLYNPLIENGYSYDLLSTDGRAMDSVSEATLIGWRDGSESVASAQTASESAIEADTKDTAERVDANTIQEENSVLQDAVEQTKLYAKEAGEKLNKATKWWDAHLKDQFRPSYWAARWNTMLVKEGESWHGEGMTEQEKKDHRRSRMILGSVTGAAGVLTMAALMHQGHDVTAAQSGIGWDGSLPHTPEMPDMTYAQTPHGSEHIASVIPGTPEGAPLVDASHVETVTTAFDAKDFTIPDGGSIDGLMAHLNIDPHKSTTIQEALLKRFPSEFFRTDDGSVGIVSPGELSRPVQDFFNTRYGGNG